MFPNFAACLELNHSCNEERKERSGELCAQSYTKTSWTQVPQETISAHVWPSVGDQSPNYLGVGLAVCLVPSPLTLFIPHAGL